MAESIIEGSVAPAEPARIKRGYAMFNQLDFTTHEGRTETLTKVGAAGDVVPALQKGGAGKFYITKFGGAKGVHGVRMDDGTSAYAHYTNIDTIIPIVLVLSIALILYGAISGEPIPILVIIVAPVLLIGYFFMRASRLAGKRQFDAG